MVEARPYQKQAMDTLWKNTRYGLFWEMRLGKSKPVVDVARFLMDTQQLDAVVVACPAQVKGVWKDKELGEIYKHCPPNKPKHVVEHANGTSFEGFLNFDGLPKWIVTSFEYLRQQDARGKYPKVEQLLKELKGKRWWLVVDEASALGNWRSLQTKAVTQLADAATRVTVLDGTPVGNSPMEQYAKFRLLGEKVLGYSSFWQFRARHAIVKKVPWTKAGTVVGFRDQASIDKRVRPYCEYLSSKGMILDPVRSFITAQLAPRTWKLYESMRDELVAELETGTVTANHAAVKALRLAQLCSGFIGGWEPYDAAGELGFKENYLLPATGVPVEVSREATDALLAWLELRLREDPEFKCVVWCRWRAEIERLREDLLTDPRFPRYSLRVGVMYGNEKAENFLHPESKLKGAAVMVVQPQAARYGVSFARASTEVFLSHDWNRVTRLQAEERIRLVGAPEPAYILDVLVAGPRGQRTVVHDILRAVREKEDVARRTAEGWIKTLKGE